MAEERNFQQQVEDFCDDVVNRIKYDRLKIWKHVFFHPSATFAEQDKNADLARGAKDVFIAHLPMLLMGLVFVAFYILLGVAATGGLMLLALPIVIGIVLLYFLFPVMGWLVAAAVYFIIAKMLGGKATFTRHAYSLALASASTVIFTLPFALLSFVPCLGYLAQMVGGIIGFYGIYLAFSATRATHGLSDGKSAVVILAPIAIAILLLVIALFLFLAVWVGMLGAAITAGSVAN